MMKRMVIQCGIVMAFLFSCASMEERAQATIPPINNLRAHEGQSGGVLLQWTTPFFQEEPEPGRGRSSTYKFKFSESYITQESFDWAQGVNGLIPDVAVDIPEVTLTLHHSMYSEPCIYYSDRAHLWAVLEVPASEFYAFRGYPLRDKLIEFTAKQCAYPNQEWAGSDDTDEDGVATWDTPDLTASVEGEYFDFKAHWDGGTVMQLNGVVVRRSGPLDDTCRRFHRNGINGCSPYPSPEGGTFDFYPGDLAVNFLIPSEALTMETELTVAIPQYVPPLGRDLPGPAAAFQVDVVQGDSTLAWPIIIRAQYPPDYLMQYGGIGECAMNAYWYDDDPDSLKWDLLPGFLLIDRLNHAVSFATQEFGLFALAAERDSDLDGLGNEQEQDWNTQPEVFDSDGDGRGDGDEAWWTRSDPADPLKLCDSDQHGLALNVGPPFHYWFAGRIVTDGEESPISVCAYLGPPINVNFVTEWEGPPLFKSDAAWGDFDGDGDLDLAVCGESGGVPGTLTYENTRYGMEQHQSLPGVRNEGSGGLAWGDYDNDGDLDLALAGLGASGPLAGVYRNDGDGNLVLDDAQQLQGVSQASPVWGDFDGDHDLDLLLMGHTGAVPATILYKNEPIGCLRPDSSVALAGLYAGSADWADYDRDGDLDLLMSGHDGALRRTILYRNHPEGVLTDDGAHGLPGVCFSDAEWGDMDDDGDLDLAITGEASAEERLARVYRNDGSATFVPVADVLPIYRSSCAWGDLDLDGDLDVAFCGYDGSGLTTALYRNDAGVFSDYGFDFPGVREGSLHLVDFDSDGDKDFFLTGADWSEGYGVLHENVGLGSGVDPHGTDEHALRLEVKGRNPIGQSALLEYCLPAAGPTELDIYDPSGRLVRRLVAGTMTEGRHQASWDGCDDRGRDTGSGVFLYQLENGTRMLRGRLVRVR